LPGPDTLIATSALVVTHATDSYGSDQTFSGGSWTTTNSAVMTVSDGYIFGVSGGQVTIQNFLSNIIVFQGNFCVSDNMNDSCPTGNPAPSGGGTTQVPTTLSVVSGVLAGSTTQCSSSAYGAKAEITYQVRDQNGGQIKASGMQPQEIIINFIINGVPQPDPAPDWANLGNPSDSNGRFKDTPLGVCAGFAVTETATQKISVFYNGNRYPASGTLRTNSLRFTGLTTGHGRICNGTDSNCTGADFDVSR